MPVNIRDIAKAAGVSVATVSKALNGYSTVNAATRAKIQRIAEEMQYHPNSAARSLVGQRSMTIGVFLTTGLANPFFAGVLGGIDRALKDRGYDLIYLAQAHAEEPGYSLMRHCRSRNVEGLLVFGMQENDMDFSELIGSGLPVVFIDMEMEGEHVGMISSDNAEAIRAEVQHLAGLNHRRIAFISGIAGTYPGRMRERGFLQGMAEQGLDRRPEYMIPGDYSRESGYEGMRRLLSLPERPTAVICCSDASAVGALEAALEQGLSVPDDLSIVGFDDVEAARSVRPALTTVRQDMQGIGYQAVGLLDDLIRGEELAEKRIILPTEWVERDSCGPAKESR
ncbi:LacI family DNA-binding transcriptional regulator [Cohnella lubricantis]|uniref:LacI family DNA-binding transcriptional regulator n=1 Tax=Cohnella lubricantis TaxID=2163172 RepID=A0A841TJW1_9BACL|nr:LacI family DNA-binding transcriptional regulator [Cohnella lubricantis]MBB6679508.1 LacI family DNA-binding transcriptional regulator [Cohnella lubricantis]MBP2118100.1 LacI family transcriptional regulator [Cohnella lubricantis]